MQNAGAEFVKWINVERIKREPITFAFTATENELADVAQRLEIVGLNFLEVSGDIHRKEGCKQLEMTATFKTEAVQSCVLTLEPVIQKIEVEFSGSYTFDKRDVTLENAEYVVSLDEDDLPEVIEGGRIDVVHAVCEQIALALDPYPRAEKAGNSGSAEILQQPDDAANGEALEVYKPFANLKDLMNKK